MEYLRSGSVGDSSISSSGSGSGSGVDGNSKDGSDSDSSSRRGSSTSTSSSTSSSGSSSGSSGVKGVKEIGVKMLLARLGLSAAMDSMRFIESVRQRLAQVTVSPPHRLTASPPDCFPLL